MDTEANTPHADEGSVKRVHAGRFWTRFLMLSTLLIVAGAVVYDLLPSLVLPYRVDAFMDVIEMGASRQQVNAELRGRGFSLPEDYGEPQNFYRIRTREPFLERVADGIALSLQRDSWWASQKHPHHAYVTYDTSNTVVSIELGSQFNPLWY